MIDWTPEMVDDICGRIMTGASVLDMDGVENLPSSDSIYRKMATDKSFAARIAHAREAQQHHEADAIVRMADLADGENWQVVQLRIKSRQWRAAKLNPRTYGDKQTTVHEDPQGNNPFASLMEAVQGAGRPKPGGD